MMNFIEHLERLIFGKIAVAKGLMTLLQLEAKLAGLNIVPLLLSIGALMALFFSGWLTVMVLIGYWLTFWFGFLIALIVILLLNIIALFLVIKSLISCIRQMSFEKTRALLRDHSKDSHELTKKITKRH
ncbi:hypothetical protein [Legionella cardiaca]|uniref:Phage holin family protein n=1 Tax=Legionella cardiaca TaxID=1071983 RepID=A0ABY8ASQ3_9GAMM|nr:hypothetical protein [Legionella cardiaca]WED43697.1 hypothetical protein PXX05_02665 [Legionella cardiaca]